MKPEWEENALRSATLRFVREFEQRQLVDFGLEFADLHEDSFDMYAEFLWDDAEKLELWCSRNFAVTSFEWRADNPCLFKDEIPDGELMWKAIPKVLREIGRNYCAPQDLRIVFSIQKNLEGDKYFTRSLEVLTEMIETEKEKHREV